MANLLFKINIETESGREISYCNTAFAATTDSNISASAIVSAIEGMDSCSYASSADAPASTAPANFEDSNNLWLSASLVGTSDTGSIKITHTDDEDTAQPMKRYRFFGTKVCNVLGLPEGQWIYPEKFHLDNTGGTNYFSGDVAATNLSLTRGLTMANTATMRSNLRYNIDKTADLFTQFTTGSGAFQSNALLLGYNSDTDKYVLDKGAENNLHIDATVVSASNAYVGDIKVSGHIVNDTGGTTFIDIDPTKISMEVGGKNCLEYISTEARIKFNNDQDDIDFRIRGQNENSFFYADVGNDCLGLHTASPLAALHFNDTTHDKNGILFQDDSSQGGAEIYLGVVNDSEKLTIGTGNTIGTGTPILTTDHANNRVGILEGSPTYTLDVGGSMGVDDFIYHNDNADTYIQFTTDQIDFYAGAVRFITLDKAGANVFVVNETAAADVNFRIESNSYASIFKMDSGLDKIGINEGTPASLLHIQQVADSNAGGIRLYNLQDGTYWSLYVNTSEYLYINYNGGANGGHIRNNSDVGQIDFTGQHRTAVSTGTINEYTSSIGYIVCADGTYDNLWDNNDNVKQDTKPNINESIPKVKLSNKAKDKTVFGVISELENFKQETNVSESFQYVEDPAEPDEKIRTRVTSSVYVREYNQGSFTTVMEAKDGNDQRLTVNSLGEGAIWVSNFSGSLENGDYVTSSPIKGLGMKQDDDLLHNYTVAKITQECTFDLAASASYDCIEFQWSGSAYRRAFVGCTYHCG